MAVIRDRALLVSIILEENWAKPKFEHDMARAKIVVCEEIIKVQMWIDTARIDTFERCRRRFGLLNLLIAIISCIALLLGCFFHGHK